MASTLRCSIVTPTDAVFDGEIAYASVPAWDGQLGVMIGQSPLLTRLGIGALRLDEPSGEHLWFLVDGGFAQVQNDELTLITERALPADAVSVEEAEAELAEANARVAQGAEDQEKVARDQARALAKKWIASVSGTR